MPKVLLVDDDRELVKQLAIALGVNSYSVETAHDGADALQLLSMQSFDVIVLDWNMPGMSGVEVCREFRGKGGQTPVVMLTAQGSVTDKEAGLDAGADDYVTKPFSLRELEARLRALLRRPQAYQATLQHGALVADSQSCTVVVDGNALRLLPTEFRLLEFFMRHPDRCLSSEELLTNVWGMDKEVSDTSVRTYIKTLRRKLADAGIDKSIETIKGLGYRLGPCQR